MTTNTETTSNVETTKAAAAPERKVGTAAKKAAKKPSKPVVTKAAKPAAKKAASKPAKTKPARKSDEPSKSVIPLEVAKAYPRTKDAKGKLHVDNGDDVAAKLRGKDLDTVYALTAKACEVGEKELRAKYGHLNPGMQRMNLGNKLRAALA